MKEIKKDLFSGLLDKETDAICITTNGSFDDHGIAMMGGGSAGQARVKWEQVPRNLGKKLKALGVNVPYLIGATDNDGSYLEPTTNVVANKKYKCLIFSFPTIGSLIKMEGANLDLIKNSCMEMMTHADHFKLKSILCPRPGTGIGGLDYHNEVKPVISSILDDRFTIVSFEHED